MNGANDFDQASRYGTKLDPPGFFAWLWQRVRPALVFRGWRDTRTLPFPGDPDRTCDTVADLDDPADPDRPVIAVVEFQSRPVGDILLRELEYIVRLLREIRAGPEGGRQYQVIGVLLNLTGPPQPSALEMRLRDRPEVGLWLGVEVRTMREEDAAATLAAIAGGQIARCILCWIPLMRGGAESGNIELWKQLADTEEDSQRRATYAGLALVFANLASCRNEWEKALEDWDMGESEVVNAWRAEGRAEGELLAKRAALLEVLRLRFANRVPAELVEAINGMTDLNELSRWFHAGVIAPSLDAFRAVVQQEVRS